MECCQAWRIFKSRHQPHSPWRSPVSICVPGNNGPPGRTGSSMQPALLQLGTDRVLVADAGGRISLGRCRDLGIAATTISRQHCTVRLSEGSEGEPHAVVTATKKRLFVWRAGQLRSKVEIVAKWSQAKVRLSGEGA